MPENDAARHPLAGFAVTLALLSRLPLLPQPDARHAEAPKMVWCYPLVGVLLGLIAVLVGQLALASGTGPAITAGAVLLTMALLTGAMHEDGLADTADGLWGGQTVARRLEIMKDSQIGSYGTMALILMTGLRWSALSALALAPSSLWPYLAAAALSRAALPAIMATTPHARSSGLSHAVGRSDPRAALLAVIIGAAVTFAFAGVWAFLILPLAAVLAWGMRALALSRLGGQTGDILGATQQVIEVAVLCLLIASFS